MSVVAKDLCTQAKPQRVLVIGTSCSGKTTFAKALSHRTGVDWHDLDVLCWGPHWTPKPEDEFRRLVQEVADGDEWIIAGNYSSVRDILWPRATTIIWLNYSFSVVLARAIRRTLYRSLTGKVLWHGNRETFRRSFFSRDSILLWVITTHHAKCQRYAALRAANVYPQLQWVEFRRPREADCFLDSLIQTPPHS